jgi:hypothetical protein
MQETEELIRNQQAKIEELQQSLKISQAQLLLQQQQLQDRDQVQLMQALHNPRNDQNIRKPIVLPNGTTLCSIKSGEVDDSSMLSHIANGVENTELLNNKNISDTSKGESMQLILTQQAQNLQLQNQLQQLQTMQQEIVTHQTQLMNTLNVVNQNVNVTQPGIQHLRQLSEDKVLPHRIGIDNLKGCIMR